MTVIAPSELDRLAEYLAGLGAAAVAWYKGPCFERRLATRLRARGCGVAEYLVILEREPDERARLLSALSVGVTSFFRNPAAWRRLGELLRSRPPGSPPFRAWSAGCATGEEAYSIAMLLRWLEDQGAPGLAEWRVLGTDLDERSLAVARAARYSPRSQADLEAAFGGGGFSVEGDRLEIDAGLKERCRFERDDLAFTSRVGAFDLVLCRNVLIYFGDLGQSRVLEALVRALRPGGLFMLGKAELAAHALSEIQPVDSRERIYRRNQ